jgi:CO dehydrogenase nickel-insertion accessory protein CooC1
MATALKIAGACRFNVVISGGTGSGKTTMLNALSKMIDPGERVLTIEDAAELRLQQPHWLPLETRPANLEGQGAITIRDLVVNALRMRPDRIILGEIRGSECFDLLAAMNTGHDGSMCTLHSNSPREALGRMENMVMMSDIKVPKEAISRQIADSVDLIVQVKRLRDGSRRVTNITEVIGMEGPVIVTQELFKFEYLDEDAERQDRAANTARWACAPTRSTRPSSSALTSPSSRPASKLSTVAQRDPASSTAIRRHLPPSTAIHRHPSSSPRKRGSSCLSDAGGGRKRQTSAIAERTDVH